MSAFQGTAAIVARKKRKEGRSGKGTPLAYPLLNSLITTNDLSDLGVYAREDGSFVIYREGDNQDGKYAFLDTTNGNLVYLTADEVSTTLHKPIRESR